jgi:predicted nucleic acid-binding protein
VIVVDASALVELILATAHGLALADRIEESSLSLHVPHCADVEVVSALGRKLRLGQIVPAEAVEALQELRSLDLNRHAHEPYLDRMMALRVNVSAYDAAYVALAEILDCTLLTTDVRLSRAPGVLCHVELISPPAA